MLYCQGYSISFQEVPDEISLVLQIAECKYHCPGCHSPELWEAKGFHLFKELPKIVEEYADAITCVCFMGEGRDPVELVQCLEYVRDLGYRTALYSGNESAWTLYPTGLLDYIKCGPYIASLGGLDSPTTNQFMLKLNHENGTYIGCENITERFRKRTD